MAPPGCHSSRSLWNPSCHAVRQPFLTATRTQSVLVCAGADSSFWAQMAAALATLARQAAQGAPSRSASTVMVPREVLECCQDGCESLARAA